tara:strand:- start:1834 stop:2049 length:216 start_codon:yes stop_codon:yes gene_type:complete
MLFKVMITLNDNIIHDKTYRSMTDIASQLGMSYQQVADISCGRVIPKYISTEFPFQPKINITKIKKENYIV